MPIKVICSHCRHELHQSRGGGWVHPLGHSYVMECPACGWKGEQPAEPMTYAKDICPQCLVQGRLQDDHSANPIATQIDK